MPSGPTWGVRSPYDDREAGGLPCARVAAAFAFAPSAVDLARPHALGAEDPVPFAPFAEAALDGGHADPGASRDRLVRDGATVPDQVGLQGVPDALGGVAAARVWVALREVGALH